MKNIWFVVALVATPSTAQVGRADAPRIQVVGHGSVRTPPDVATISYTLRGEGRTSDEATRALVARQSATEAVLAGHAEVRTGKLSISEAREKACDSGEDNDYDANTRLSTGACAVVGYVATLAVTAKVTPVADAGTLLELVGRVGGIDPRLDDYDLKDARTANAAAVAAAIGDARSQAQAIAAASNVRLGPLLRVEDQRAVGEAPQDIVVTASRNAPPTVAPPPIVIALKPEPIETEARLVVEFAIGATP